MGSEKKVAAASASNASRRDSGAGQTNLPVL
jgi:hypothetical protein